MWRDPVVQCHTVDENLYYLHTTNICPHNLAVSTCHTTYVVCANFIQFESDGFCYQPVFL